VGAHAVTLAQSPGGDALERVHQAGDGHVWRGGDEQVDVVVLAIYLNQLGAEVGAHAGEHLAEGAQVLAVSTHASTWLPRPHAR
jgi:hypothetical protein